MARPTQRPGNLPAEATSFIGRRRELAEIRTTLTHARLVSLIGPGGVGKSRLAIRAAADLGRGFRGGAWLVELADVRDPALVSNAVMGALDLRDQAAAEPRDLVLTYLKDKELLLVVDNCEHLLAAAAQIVNDIITTAPGVRVIATSREPLYARGEHVVPVPPLELPAPHPAQPLDRLRHNESVTLFSQRAKAASGTFELTTANQAAVVELCRRLDGLPLAIELAAVRTRVLAVEQILHRLGDRFGLLTGASRGALPRHQTLATTIDWSHDLLFDAERVLLRRLCVFAGRFTLEDVEPICAIAPAPTDSALDLLSSLVDKSLVMKHDVRDVACYRLHETMREYAALKLTAAGERDDVELRCAEYYRTRCAQSAQEGRYRLPAWLQWADLEIDNVRAVLRRCLNRGDAELGIDLAASLGWYWTTRATTEGVRWLDALLDSSGGDPLARARAYFIRGFLSVLKADPAAARPALHAAVAAARQSQQQDLLSEALSMASIAENMAGERASAKRLLDEAHATTTGLAYIPGTLAVLQARALDGFFDNDLDAVRSAASDGAHLARQSGDLYVLQVMLVNLGIAALIGGDRDDAKPSLAEALTIARQLDDRVAQFHLLAAFGCHAARSGQHPLAVRLLAAADTMRTEAGANVMPFLAPSLAKAAESARATLGETRFETEYEAGKQLNADTALGLALGAPARRTDLGTANASAGPLARREADVARLVADGLTNKQIGARLFISERTVDSHVRSILNKLGFNSRAQIAAWTTTTEGADLPSTPPPRSRTATPRTAHD